MEILFRTLIDEDENVTYATFQFKGITRVGYENNIDPITSKETLDLAIGKKENIGRCKNTSQAYIDPPNDRYPMKPPVGKSHQRYGG